jgi:hypothetical protein
MAQKKPPAATPPYVTAAEISAAVCSRLNLGSCSVVLDA